jgi:hypothetical protein
MRENLPESALEIPSAANPDITAAKVRGRRMCSGEAME